MNVIVGSWSYPRRHLLYMHGVQKHIGHLVVPSVQLHGLNRRRWTDIHQMSLLRCDVGVAEEAIAAAALAAASASSVGLAHAAGVLADALLANQKPALVRRVFAPKAAAEQALSQVSQTFLVVC